MGGKWLCSLIECSEICNLIGDRDDGPWMQHKHCSHPLTDANGWEVLEAFLSCTKETEAGTLACEIWFYPLLLKDVWRTHPSNWILNWISYYCFSLFPVLLWQIFRHLSMYNISIVWSNFHQLIDVLNIWSDVEVMLKMEPIQIQTAVVIHGV